MPNADGTEVKVTEEARMDAAKTVIKDLVPLLSARQVTGANDGPIAMATCDMSKLVSTPEGSKAHRYAGLDVGKTGRPGAIFISKIIVIQSLVFVTKELP
jgi:hypothetical protein